jgi:hypothetical protein
MIYPFNYLHDPKGPPIGEVTIFTNVAIDITFTLPLFISYRISRTHSNVSSIVEPIEMLVLSTTNPAHSLGEFTSFLEYYRTKKEQPKVCINSTIVTKMPYLYGLISLFIPEDKRLLIDSDTIYTFTSVTFRRNHHFVYLQEWNTFAFTVSDNIMLFNDLRRAKDLYSVNCSRLFEKAKEIYDTHRHRYELYDSIMMIKTAKEKYSVSPNRALSYPDQNIRTMIADKGIQFVEVSQFRDIYEYICTIYHAKNIVFSYGGPMCINRFFCNPDANIIVLANMHYKHEYEYNNSSKDYWHLRHAMLSPVKRQHFILDFDNTLTKDNVTQICSLLE